MRGLALEVRVGILILTALAVLGAFVFLLGDLGFGDGYVVYADFDNPGNVHSGAAVLVGGVQVGTVEGV
jgi:phospholipid/cholesterol/gamma-HCH transport system substrate-binding protein